MENHGKTHGQIMEKSWKNHGKVMVSCRFSLKNPSINSSRPVFVAPRWSPTDGMVAMPSPLPGELGGISPIQKVQKKQRVGIYPLENIQKTMENLNL